LRARHFSAFADGIGDFAGLAQAHTHFAALVTHDNQRAEIKPAAALDDLGGSVDENDLFDQVLLGAFATGLRFWPGPVSPAPEATTAAAATKTTTLAAFAALTTRTGTAETAGVSAIGWDLIAAFYICWFSHNILLR
jgi:hypothetical protein